MKIQLQAQSIRIRITESELAQLRSGETLTNTTAWSANHAWQLQLELTDNDAFSAINNIANLRISIPKKILEAYCLRLPCRDGLSAEIKVTAEIKLNIEFDVDVRDSVKTRGPKRRQ